MLRITSVFRTPIVRSRSPIAATFSRMVSIVPVPFMSDNYAYLLIPDGVIGTTQREVAVVDPADHKKVQKALESLNLSWENVKYVFVTHKHGDHSAGNKPIKKLSPKTIIVAPANENPIPFSDGT